MADGGDQFNDKNAPWWAAYARWAVQTIGIPGILLCGFMAGGYMITTHVIDSITPTIKDVGAAAVEHMRKQTETTEQISRTQESQVENQRLQIDLLQGQGKMIEGLHSKIDGVSTRLEKVEGRLGTKP